MISSGDIKYLAGLWEGEGCWLRVGKTPGMSLCMTDEDVIKSAAERMGYSHHIYTRPRLEGHKTTFQFRLPTPLSVQWMMTLYILLGKRRREKIAQLIALWKTSQYPAKMRRECPNGHVFTPDNIEIRSKHGKSYGVCRTCRRTHSRESAARRRERSANTIA